jgi:GNAT superfamily N-acetyltransferase
MSLFIRPIARGDVTAAAKVVIGGSLSAQFEDPDAVDSYWSAVENTRARYGDILVADVDGEVVGVCQVLIFQHFQHTGGWCCELESVHVRDDHRSQGIGAALLAGAESLAREKNCYRLQLTSRNVRLDAHRFYVANGFESTSKGFKKSLGTGHLA